MLFKRLKIAYDTNDNAAIYHLACTFVEVCRSLSLSKLEGTASVIMEAYRPENSDSREVFHVEDLFETLTEQYNNTIDEIRKNLNVSE